jgi:ABC-type sugar transport system ATPase subunit
MSGAGTALLRARGLRKDYGKGEALVRAVDEVDLDVATGETLAVMGPSGCGKSTLLHLLGGLDRPSAGELWLNDRRTDRLSERALAGLRRGQIGFVFQAFHLMDELTARENIELPALLAGRSSTTRWSCWPMSRPATWTARRRLTCCGPGRAARRRDRRGDRHTHDALSMNGVTSQPYSATKTATDGPDVVAYLTSTGQAKALVHAPGVASSSGPYPVVAATIGSAAVPRGSSLRVAARRRRPPSTGRT